MVCPGVMTGIGSKISDRQDNSILYVLCALAALKWTHLQSRVGPFEHAVLAGPPQVPLLRFTPLLAASVLRSGWKLFSGTKSVTRGRPAAIGGWILSTCTASSTV